MKFIKTYKIFELYNVGDIITCHNCKWKWKTEKNDDRKYLCHSCGYDNELKKFDMKSLNKWKKESPKTTFQRKNSIR